MTAQCFRLMVTHDGLHTVVTLIGRFDAHARTALAQCLGELAVAGELRVVIDLSDLELPDVPAAANAVVLTP